MKNSIAHIATAVRYLAILCFFSYVTAAIFLGGDAINGHEESGRFFLGGGGQNTEVSRKVFLYSRYHSYALFALFGLGVLSVLLFKPGLVEAKWQGRLVTIATVATAGLMYWRYGA